MLIQKSYEVTNTQRPSAGTLTVVNDSNPANRQYKSIMSLGPYTLEATDVVRLTGYQECTNDTTNVINVEVSFRVVAVPAATGSPQDAHYGTAGITNTDASFVENCDPTRHHIIAHWDGSITGLSGDFYFNVSAFSASGALTHPATDTLTVNNSQLGQLRHCVEIQRVMTDIESAGAEFVDAVQDTLSAVLPLASQAEAEAGSLNNKSMSPLRCAQAIAALGGSTPFYPRNYISGVVCSVNSTDSNNDIDISVGKCMDSTDATLMSLASALTKRIDASWSVGTNQGGLDTGSKSAGQWYYIHLIAKPDGTTDALFSLSRTSPTLPTGYTIFRHIGTIGLDGSSNIIGYTCLEVLDGVVLNQWKNPTWDIASTLSTTQQSISGLVLPPGRTVVANISVYCTHTSAWAACFGMTGSVLGSPALNNRPMAQIAGAANVTVNDVFQIGVDASGGFVGRASASSGSTITFSAGVISWLDHRK